VAAILNGYGIHYMKTPGDPITVEIMSTLQESMNLVLRPFMNHATPNHLYESGHCAIDRLLFPVDYSPDKRIELLGAFF
jgi:hypothetical protein